MAYLKKFPWDHQANMFGAIWMASTTPTAAAMRSMVLAAYAHRLSGSAVLFAAFGLGGRPAVSRPILP